MGLLVALVCLLPVGCAQQGAGAGLEPREPACRYQGRQGTAVVILMAQAVPTASQPPCVELPPAGWTVSDVFVRNGRVRFARLRPGRQCTPCRCSSSSSVPRQGHQGAVGPSRHRRYQEVISIDPGRRYQGAVHHLFPGGCVTYRLDFRSDEQARPLGEVLLALGFVPRDTLRQTLDDVTGGEPLDPPAASS